MLKGRVDVGETGHHLCIEKDDDRPIASSDLPDPLKTLRRVLNVDPVLNDHAVIGIH
jgi:hypothetical protein